MSPVSFPVPNYRCRVSGNGRIRRSVRLCCAENETAARELLEGKGYTVHAVESYDFDGEWLKKARGETAKVVAARSCGTECEFPDHWKELKDILLDAFRGKCAYCEAEFDHVTYGDVDHYRPKARVDEDSGHQGYYWLAYDPQNYLLSCQKCNQEAKQNHFPLAATGRRAYGPDDPLELEQPLLLNPLQESHAKHITYVPSDAARVPGRAIGLDDIGYTTVTIINLNRDPLVHARHKAMDYARTQVKIALASEDVDLLKRVLESILTKEHEFHSAAFCEVNTYCQKMGLSLTTVG